ncbi:MAG: ribosome recycling factor [bacterium]|nr:ribosome recycling factor [bacterium]
MFLEDVYTKTKDHMKKTVEATKNEFMSIRTGKASTSLLDNIKVEYFGSLMPVNQLASINIPEPRLIVIQPWDKSILENITKAISKSSLNLNPSSDGHVIRISIPTLTTERRKELDKAVKKKAEEGRIAVRNVRRDANHQIKNLKDAKEISEDEAEKAEDKVQEMTNETIKEIDNLLAAKEKEILEF